MAVLPQFSPGNAGAQMARNLVDSPMNLIERAQRLQHEKQLQPLRVAGQVQQLQQNAELHQYSMANEAMKMQLNQAKFQALKVEEAKVIAASQFASDNLPALFDYGDQIDDIKTEEELRDYVDNARQQFRPGMKDEEFSNIFESAIVGRANQHAEVLKNQRAAKLLDNVPPSRRGLTIESAQALAGDRYEVIPDGQGAFAVTDTPTLQAQDRAGAMLAMVQNAETPEELKSAVQNLSDIPASLQDGIQKAVKERRKEFSRAITPASEEKARQASRDLIETVTRIDETITMLEEPGRLTGAGTGMREFFEGVKSMFVGPSEWLVKRESLAVYLGDFIMQRVSQTKGAVSEKEMDLFKQFSPNPKNSEEANLAILKRARDLLNKIYDRQQLLTASGYDLSSMTNEQKERLFDLYDQGNYPTPQEFGSVGTSGQNDPFVRNLSDITGTSDQSVRRSPTRRPNE